MTDSSPPEDSSDPNVEMYVFHLYIAGPSPLSRRAIVNTRRICEEHLSGRYLLEVIDLCHHPDLAGSEQIIAAPTLMKKAPLPVRRFVGDMSRTEIILRGLDLPATDEISPPEAP